LHNFTSNSFRMKDVISLKSAPTQGQRQHQNVLPDAVTAVDHYEETEDAVCWLANFKELAALFHWSEEECLRIARIRLKGSAQRWSRTNRQLNSWEDFEQQFITRFSGTPEMALARLESCFQQPGEPVMEFADRFLDLADRAGRQADTALLHQFIRHLQSQPEKGGHQTTSSQYL